MDADGDAQAMTGRQEPGWQVRKEMVAASSLPLGTCPLPQKAKYHFSQKGLCSQGPRCALVSLQTLFPCLPVAVATYWNTYFPKWNVGWPMKSTTLVYLYPLMGGLMLASCVYHLFYFNGNILGVSNIYGAAASQAVVLLQSYFPQLFLINFPSQMVMVRR